MFSLRKPSRILPIAYAAAMSFSAMAQSSTASISGVVSLPTGEVLPNAKIVVTDIAKGVSYTATSGSTGTYALPVLPVGDYTVHVEAQGFKSIERTGLTLVIDQHLDLNFSLTIGDASETISITAAAPQLDTETHSNGTVVDAQKIEQLPLNSRTFYSLALLVPGVMPPASNSSLGYRGGFNVAGAPESANNFTLDGFDNNNEQVNIPGYRPSVDAIEEFKVLTGLYNAEFGRDAGGQVIVTGKSGTNKFHGLAYEYLRNQLFDAKNYTIQPGFKPSFKRNQFGGTFGGPIIKDRTFFFFNYEGLRFHQQLSVLSSVPTAAMLGGDFGALLTGAAKVQLRNPFTGAAIANNRISTLAQWNTPAATIGKALASYFPSPSNNSVGPNGAPLNNYNFNALRTESSNQYGLRIDHTLSPHDSVYAEYNYFDNPSFEPYNSLCGPRTIPGFGCYSGVGYQLGGISETHIFSPAVVNTIRAAYTRYRQNRTQQDGNIDFIGTYGLPNVFLGNTPGNLGLPQTAISGYATLGGPSNNPQDFINNEMQGVDQLIWTHRNHTLKFGADIRRNQQNDLSILTGRGALTFTAGATTPTTGYALADLLLGLPTTSSNNPYAPKIYVRTTAFDGYAQDDWKATPKLTLNMGLRWELNTPFTALGDQQSSFVPSGAGAVVRAGTGGYADNLIQYDYTKFQPRVGFSYAAGDNTVLRGGYGIYASAPASFSGIGNLFYNAPMRNPQTFNNGIASGVCTSVTNPCSPTFQLNNPFPTTSTSSSAPYGIDYHFLNPYIQQFGLGVQRQLSADLLLDVSYFGSKGTHLPNQININQATPNASTSTTLANARRPFPNFGNVLWYQSVGASNFNSLLVKLDKRLSHGLNLLVSYSYAHSLDNTPGFNGSNASNAQPQNSLDLSSEYGSSDFDIRNRLTVSSVYQLPFGKGQAYVQHGIGSALAGGWQLSGIYSQNSARPFTVYFSSNVSNTLNVHDRPNVIGDVNAGPHTATAWFNAAAFTTAAQTMGTYGNERRNAVKGPRSFDLDSTLSRNFTLTDRFNLQFRAEFFNVLNHPNFDLPNAVSGGAGYNTITTVADPRQLQLALRLNF